MPLDRFRLDRGDGESGGFKRLLECFGLGARADIETLEFLSVGADEAGFERLVAWRRQRCNQRPIFPADEFLDFEFAVANQPQRHRLDATGRAGAGKLAPQHRRKRETDEIVERPPREIGIDQGLVDAARMVHRFRHRLLGDGVEHDAFDRLPVQGLLLLEHLKHVPGNRFAFAVGVGRQNELVGAFGRLGDVVETLLRLGVDFPDHLEIGVGIDRAIFGRQVAHVPKGSQNLVAAAEVLIDRLRLCGRFYHYKIHNNPMIYRLFRPSRTLPRRLPAAGNMGNATPPVKSLPPGRKAASGVKTQGNMAICGNP